MPFLTRDIRRFESKFTKGAPNDCWLWSASASGDGYGQIMIQSKMRKAHRLSYMIYRGEITGGLHVLHRCDVKLCVNPAHLFLGTNEDNIRDKIAKGRGRAGMGERHRKAVLTDEKVREIRRRHWRLNHNRSNTRQLAAEFGVSVVQILTIVRGEQWRHLL